MSNVDSSQPFDPRLEDIAGVIADAIAKQVNTIVDEFIEEHLSTEPVKRYIFRLLEKVANFIAAMTALVLSILNGLESIKTITIVRNAFSKV